MPSVGPISEYGIKSSLIQQILGRRAKGNDFGSLLLNMENAKLLKQIVDSRSQKTRSISSANLAISDRYASSARRSRIGSQNASNMISRIDTAHAALDNSQEIVNRLNELSSMALDATLTNDDRTSLDAEAQALKQELSDMQSMQFNGSSILQGNAISTFTGEGTLSVNDPDLSAINADLAAIDLSSKESALSSMTNIRNASNKLSVEKAKSGASRNRLQRTSDTAITIANNMEESSNRIRENEMGVVGNLFGSELADIVNELLGFSF